MKNFKSAAVLFAVPLMLTVSACASHKYVDEKVGAVNGRVDGHDSRLSQLDATTRDALDRATSAGKLAEGKFVYSVVLTDESVRFESGKAVLSEGARANLAQIADRLKADNKNVYLEIQGYTDSTGSDAVNYRLGEDRADSVRRFLNSQGVALNRMASISYGSEHPVAANTNAAGRSANRRVVIVVLS